MSLEKNTVLKSVTVYTNYVLGVNEAEEISEDGNVINSQESVRNIQPIDDVSGESGLVAELAEKLFTDEVKAAYTASLTAEPEAEESSEE
tara:strand:+ start:1318 stop:1587 length:270 start_codon:yes stop_codon:yes gene_type:complete